MVTELWAITIYAHVKSQHQTVVHLYLIGFAARRVELEAGWMSQKGHSTTVP